MKSIHVLLTLATSLFLACGDDGGSTTPDATPANCFAEPSYAVTALGGPVAESGGGMSADIPLEVLAGGRLQETMLPDILALELFATFGVFANNGNQITPGTYNLEGLELNYQSCGICVRILTNVDMEGSNPDGDSGYLATGGSVTINSINPNVSFTLTDVTFEHVNIDMNNFNSTPHPDGCLSAVPSLTFDSPVTYTPPMAAQQGRADQPAGARWPGRSRYVRK